MSAPGFNFPVIAFRADGDVETFRVAKSLPGGDCGIGLDSGATLVDRDGRAWIAQEREMAWSEMSRASRIFRGLFGLPPLLGMSYVERAPVSFEEVMDRVCATVDAYPENWMSEHLVDTDNEPVGLAAQGAIMKDWVRQATRLDHIVQLLWWTDWDGRQALVDSWQVGHSPPSNTIETGPSSG